MIAMKNRLTHMFTECHYDVVYKDNRYTFISKVYPGKNGPVESSLIDFKGDPIEDEELKREIVRWIVLQWM